MIAVDSPTFATRKGAELVSPQREARHDRPSAHAESIQGAWIATVLVADTEVLIAAWRTDGRGGSASAARSDYGITGQDGLYLGEFLAAKGYEVFGMVRGQSNPKIPTVEDYISSIQLLERDLRDLSSLLGVLETARPDEIYDLGAISFVGLSSKQPELTGDITGMSVLRMLEAVRSQRRN